MKPITYLILSTLTLASCAGPESFEDKMDRYTPKKLSKNQVPDFSPSTKHLSFNSRIPASQSSSPSTGVPSLDENQLSNKRLYFLTLLDQYDSMKTYSYQFEAPSVSICPQFHTSLVTHKNKNNMIKGPAYSSSRVAKVFKYDLSKMNDEAYISMHPELMLPLSKEDIHPKVIDIIRSEKEKMSDLKISDYVHQALDIHLSKTYTEIQELCEYGVSDNYYIYENLITHIKKSNFQPDEKNLNILLKTTLFSNHAIVTSIQSAQKEKSTGRSIASSPNESFSNGNYTSQVMTRLNVEWAKNYFDYLKR